MGEYMDRVYDIGRYEVASSLDEVSLWSAMFGILMLEHLPLRPGARVLDIGCGTDSPLLELARRLGCGSTVIAADTRRAGLERAGRNARPQFSRGLLLSRRAECFSLLRSEGKSPVHGRNELDFDLRADRYTAVHVASLGDSGLETWFLPR